MRFVIIYQYGLVKTKNTFLPKIDKYMKNLRSSLLEVLRQKHTLKGLRKSTRKRPYQSLPLNKVAN